MQIEPPASPRVHGCALPASWKDRAWGRALRAAGTGHLAVCSCPSFSFQGGIASLHGPSEASQGWENTGERSQQRHVPASSDLEAGVSLVEEAGRWHPSQHGSPRDSPSPGDQLGGSQHPQAVPHSLWSHGSWRGDARGALPGIPHMGQRTMSGSAPLFSQRFLGAEAASESSLSSAFRNKSIYFAFPFPH